METAGYNLVLVHPVCTRGQPPTHSFYYDPFHATNKFLSRLFLVGQYHQSFLQNHLGFSTCCDMTMLFIPSGFSDQGTQA